MLTQEVHELDAPDVAGLRVQEAVEKVRGSVRIGDRDVTAGQLLESLGFARERVWTPVRELSGGERRRLQLLRLLMSEPNVLALDEPTNDLDTDTLAAVEDALDGWPGTLLVVSHDRYLLERICDRQVALLGDGRIRDLPGGVEEYLALRRAVVSASSGTPPVRDTAGGPSAGDARAARKELARLERQLSRLAEQEHRLHGQLAEKATDHEAVLELDARLRALQEERVRLEEEWLEAAELAG
jgi:ABC-type multidrug transport system ATPase subunit